MEYDVTFFYPALRTSDGIYANKILEEACLKHAKDIKFAPATIGGEPADLVADIPFKFTISDEPPEPERIKLGIWGLAIDR